MTNHDINRDVAICRASEYSVQVHLFIEIVANQRKRTFILFFSFSFSLETTTCFLRTCVDVSKERKKKIHAPYHTASFEILTMSTQQRSFLSRALRSIVIRFRSIILILFNLWMNYSVHNLTYLYRSVKFLGRYVQVFFGIITGSHYSLVNVSDDDFRIGTTAYQLFKPTDHPQDLNQPDLNDVFHIYLSKILYESSEQIIEQCLDWGFEKRSIEIYRYAQESDLTKYSYSTQATVIHHEESNRIVVAFRGTEPMDLLQWLTDASTNFMLVPNKFHTDADADSQVRVHAGFYAALGLSTFDPFKPIDFNQTTADSPMFLQLLNSIQQYHRNDKPCQITITGHSLGGGLASLFSYVLLAYGYESFISGVYTYGQPLVGNRDYAQLLNKKLGNRYHRWVNHSDIIPRIPVIELPSIAWYYARTPYCDALEVAANQNLKKLDPYREYYYHAGLRLKIDHLGNLVEDKFNSQEPQLAFDEPLHLFDFIYCLRNAVYALFNITPLRSFLWLVVPTEINDHFPGDYARSIKKIVNKIK